MGQHGKRRTIVALTMCATTIHGAWWAIDVRANDDRLLRIDLVVLRGLGKSQISLVRREVDTIWAPQAVRIEWSGGETAGCVRVVIDRPASVLPPAPAGWDEQWSVAATRIVEGQVSGPIYVSVEAAERVMRSASPPYSAPALAGVMVPRVVGRSIAHELAHVLLNTRAHALHGLLRARFSADEFVDPGRDAFTLDDEQLARARQHELLAAPAVTRF